MAKQGAKTTLVYVRVAKHRVIEKMLNNVVPGVNVDLDAKGKLAGIEIHDDCTSIAVDGTIIWAAPGASDEVGKPLNITIKATHR